MAKEPYSRARSSQFQLRFSDDLHQRLKAAAARNERPINAEIIYRIERSFDPAAGLRDDVGRAIDTLVEAEVQRRLRAIAENIGRES